MAQHPALQEFLDRSTDDYISVPLKVSSNVLVNADHQIQLPAEFDPVYIELGLNLLRLTNQPSAEAQSSNSGETQARSYLLENLINDSGRLAVTNTSTRNPSITTTTIIGRQSTPSLELSKSAGRRHLALTFLGGYVRLGDLDSQNGTVVHTKNYTASDWSTAFYGEVL
jgi:hypothetical protein